MSKSSMPAEPWTSTSVKTTPKPRLVPGVSLPGMKKSAWVTVEPSGENSRSGLKVPKRSLSPGVDVVELDAHAARGGRGELEPGARRGELDAPGPREGVEVEEVAREGVGGGDRVGRGVPVDLPAALAERAGVRGVQRAELGAEGLDGREDRVGVGAAASNTAAPLGLPAVAEPAAASMTETVDRTIALVRLDMVKLLV
jgi:hypothetical protein